jgi:hypothetical protein
MANNNDFNQQGQRKANGTGNPNGNPNASANANANAGTGSNYAPAYTHQGYGPPPSQAQTLRNAQYIHTANPQMQVHGDNGMNALNHGFGAMNLHPAYGDASRGSSQLSAAASEYGLSHQHNPTGYQPIPVNNQYAYGNGQLAQATPAAQTTNAMYHGQGYGQYHGGQHYNAPYVQQTYGSDNGSNSLYVPRGLMPPDAMGMSSVPSLTTPRRPSMASTNEDTASSIVTSTSFSFAPGYPGVPTAIVERSPNLPTGTFTSSNNTPSPSPYAQSFQQQARYKVTTVSPHLQMILMREPAIPPAIPAPSSPMKPLDRCLENKNGETNVYVRGLLPETTDQMLFDWAIRFGEILSSKSIIDHKNGLCKG